MAKRSQSIIAAAWLVFSATALGAEWSTAELQLQYGRLAAPYVGGDAATSTLTLQHASGWSLGEVFFFVDLIDARPEGSSGKRDAYSELYVSASVPRLAGRPLGGGALRDVALLGGVNWAADANVVKWLPGLRLSWNLPGFSFLNTDLTAYLDASGGLAGGGAPAESDTFMLDVNWALPFRIAEQRLSLEGHVEWIGGRTNELGQRVHPWLLGQPQLRFDLGQALRDRPDVLFVGVEWQFWVNKLGDPDTDESALQALVVWRP